MTPLLAKQTLLRMAVGSGVAPSAIHDDAAAAFNAAYQLLWASPKTRYFTEENPSVTVVQNVATYALAVNTLKVIGPTKLGGYDLIEVEKLANFERPELLGLSLPESGSPRIYYLDSGRRAADYAYESGPPDVVALTLRLKPTPNAAGTLTYHATTHPPRWTAWELESDTGTMPAPQEYFESVLLPVARRYMSRCPWFEGDELTRKGIDDDYQTALALLGLLRPGTDAQSQSVQA